MISFFYENYRRVEILHYVSVSQMTITTYFVPHSWFIIGVVTWVTRQMPLAEQELLTLPEYLGSFPVCSRACFALSWVFCVVYCRSLLGLFIFFFILTIVLSVLLRFTVSDYPFGIFKPIIILLFSSAKLKNLE